MSTHCNRYPECGCHYHVGTKCNLPDGDTRLLEKETLPTFDDAIAEAKLKELNESLLYDDRIRGQKKRRRGSNYTPPKKRRK